MYRHFPTLALALGLLGCATPMAGDWEIEAVEQDDCTMTMEIEQEGEELSGEADVSCRLWFTIEGENYYYDLEASGADLEGDYESDGDFQITVGFWDDFFEEDIEIELEGELDGDELSGDITVWGSDFGEFEGQID